MTHLVEQARRQATRLKIDVYAVYLAYRDPRVPWYARVYAVCVVAYALSPIDLIPDPIPVLGYLDDVVLIPLGVALALKMIPAEVMDEKRERARQLAQEGGLVSRAGAVMVVAMWLAAVCVAILIVLRFF